MARWSKTRTGYPLPAKGNGLGRPGIAGAVGVGIGLLLGGRLVKTYDWRTEWTVPAPLPVVYDAMTSRSAVREWWPSMQLVDEGGATNSGRAAP